VPLLGTYFAETMLILVLCLIKLEKTDELLIIVQHAQQFWKDILADHHCKYVYGVQESAKLIANKYSRILSLIFEMAVTVIKENLKVKFVKILLMICKDLCPHNLRHNVYRDFPSEDATSFLIIQCCLELDQPDRLINYSKEYEQLLRRKSKTNLVQIAQAMIAFGEKHVKYLKPVANRVEYFPLLESLMSNARIFGKIISDDLHTMNLDTIRAAKETIEFCQHRLSSEPIAVDGWSWGTEWYKFEKQEIESANKLFL